MTTSFFNETTDHELDLQALKTVNGGIAPVAFGGALGLGVLIGLGGSAVTSLIADATSGKEIGSTMGELYDTVTDSLDDLVNGGGDVNTGNADSGSGDTASQ